MFRQSELIEGQIVEAFKFEQLVNLLIVVVV